MTPDQSEQIEQPVVDLLTALESGLAEGDVGEADPDLPPDQLRLYHLARESMMRLEGVFPRGSRASGHGGSGSFDPLRATGRIGKFRIQRELGRGGGGVVFLATDTETGKEVALKLPRLEALLDPELRRRFQQEARLTVGLDHPYLLPVFEAGEIDAVCYIASAYASETTLEAWLERQREPVPLRTAAAIVAALASGVAYLHKHHILHRDIKPSNILLVPRRGEGHDPDLAASGAPCLTDFGLAKLLEAATGASTVGGTMTGTLVLGTAEYMAPEQADARPERLGPPSDVYGLGAVLYELLAGQPPFRGRNKFDTLQKVLLDDPVRPRKLRPGGVSRDLEAICLKCLEKNPRNRYATADVLAEDLRRYLRGQRPLARMTPWWTRAGRWSRRRPGAAVTTAVAVFAPIALLLAALAFDRSVKKAHAEELRRALYSADIANLGPIIERLHEHLPYVENELRNVIQAERGYQRLQLRAALVLAPVDESAANYLKRCSMGATPAEIRLICDALKAHPEGPIHDWLEIYEDPMADRSQQLRAACCLAQLQSKGTFWNSASRTVVELLASESRLTVAGWSGLLGPVRRRLVPGLAEVFGDPSRDPGARDVAAVLLAEYCADEPADLVRFLAEASPSQFEFFFARLRFVSGISVPFLEGALAEAPPPVTDTSSYESFARRQANLAIALWRLGKPEHVLERLKRQTETDIRYQVIHRLAPCGADPVLIADAFKNASDNSMIAAIILVLGDYPADALPATLRSEVRFRLGEICRQNLDAGTHAAAVWLSRLWDPKAPMPTQTEDEARRRGANWFTTGQGHTLAALQPVGVTLRPFVVATSEVTVDQFLAFRPDHHYSRRIAPEGECPVHDVTFLDAAAYCNWLTEQEGLPVSECCYRLSKAKDGTMTLDQFLPERRGYRLPTEAEWDYACRARATTTRFFGNSVEYLPKYAWYYDNSRARSWPVQRLRPNPFGLFDVYGNVAEWCHQTVGGITPDQEIVRGASWGQLSDDPAAEPERHLPRTYHDAHVGFRIARAYTP